MRVSSGIYLKSDLRRRLDDLSRELDYVLSMDGFYPHEASLNSFLSCLFKVYVYFWCSRSTNVYFKRLKNGNKSL